MPLLIIFFGIIFPRGLIIILWLFTAWFTGVFETIIWPVLGFMFAPYTLLWYSAVENWYGSEWDTFQLIILALTIIADLAAVGGKKSLEPKHES